MDRQIFFSYRWDDKEYVLNFYKKLKSYNYKVWIDENELHLGDNLPRSISEALLATDCFVIFLSKSSYSALSEKRGGFNIEIEKILSIKETRQSIGQSTQIILIDLEGFSSEAITKLPLLLSLASDLRLNSKDAYKSFKKGNNKILNEKVREFIRRALNNELVLFPRVKRIDKTNNIYLLSWLGSGDNDFIQAKKQYVEWERTSKPFIPVVAVNDDPTLQINFSHNLITDNQNESWWSAVVGINCCGIKDMWNTIDITRYKTLHFEARAYYNDKKIIPLKSTIPLKIRFEDCATNACEGSFHQSSSWNEVPINLTENFRLYSLELNRDFSWTKLSWSGNTEQINKKQILQLVFGHNEDVETCAGCIEIRDIRLQPK